MEKGILLAGNLLVDIIKIIDVYPKQGMLCNIHSQSLAVGGLVPNVGINLAIMDKNLPIYAAGRIGSDANGDYVLNELKKYGINTRHIIKDEKYTSYSDVITLKDTGVRTFFHYRGANAEFKEEDIDFSNIDCDIMHIGYALLLDKMDLPDEEYGTKMAKALFNARKKGLKTSIDVVSEESERFESLVVPCIKYCDYIIINEIESSYVSKIPLRNNNGGIIEENLPKVCKWFMDKGLNDIICIHFPEGACALDKSGNYAQMPSLSLPQGYIKGTVGAGDAFCAGMLYSLYKGFVLEECLITAINAAACNLSAADSVSGMKDIEQVLKLHENFERRKDIDYIISKI